jgi:hypothetical protein
MVFHKANLLICLHFPTLVLMDVKYDIVRKKFDFQGHSLLRMFT